MDVTQLPRPAVPPAAILPAPELAQQLAAGVKRGASALVTGADTSGVLTDTATLLSGSGTRVLRVRPPYNLTSFMQQLAPTASEEDGSLLDEAYTTLAVLDPSSKRICLLAEDAHLLPKTTLRYLESALRNRPHLSVVLAGQPELAESIRQHGLNDLNGRLSQAFALAPPDGRTAHAPARPAGRRTWLVGGVLAVACAGLVASQLPAGMLPFALPTLPSLNLPSLNLPSLNLPVALPWGAPAPAPALAPGQAPDAAQAGSAAVPAVAEAQPPNPSPSQPEGMAELASATATPTPSVAVPPAAAPPAAVPPTALLPVGVAAASIAVSVDPAVAALLATAAAPAPPPAAATAAAGPDMASLPGGEFRMGSNDEPSEKPVRSVVVAPFLIARTAVTVRDWGRCVAAKACPAASAGQPDEPVTNVSWDDARGYLSWLSRATRKSYRLPTEAEWEYAARAGSTSRYHWGNAMLPGRASCKGCGTEQVSTQSPPRVDAYPPNAFGLYGMSGGAAEWVADCWHRTYQGAPRNGSTPWDAPDCRERVLRGGSWVERPLALRTSSRDYYDATVRYPTHGFRVALSR